MPIVHVNVWEVFDKLKENPSWKDIPIVFLTARTDEIAENAGSFLGDDYIEKPFDLDYLKARIDNLLSSRVTLAKKYMNKPDETTLAEIRSQPDKDLMKESLKNEVSNVLSTLTEREAEVIKLYFGIEGDHSATLEEIGERFNLTRERVRQIEASALKKLKHPGIGRILRAYMEM